MTENWTNQGKETGKEIATIRDAANWWVADCRMEWANLIAAAPELLEVAQMIIDYEHGLKGGLSDCVKAARAAIAKAKGEA